MSCRSLHFLTLFTQIPIYAGVLITGVDAFTFLLLEQLGGLRRLEYFFG